MKIRHKIASEFALLVAMILLVFSAIVYLTAENQRQNNFYERLQRRASTTARLLVDVREFDASLLRLIDKNSAAKLPNEEVFVFNYKDKLIYSNVERKPAYLTSSLMDEIRLKQRVTFQEADQEVIGVIFAGRYDRFVVVAAATDKAGRLQLKNLLRTLTVGLLTGIILTVGLSILFARQALKPFQRINRQISYISAKDLSRRLTESKNQDEIGELAANFNRMLQRLELAFRQQKQFVSHASHELRTPLAALKTEIQVGLQQPQTLEEHREILHNLQNDTDRLIELSNALLQLARLVDSPDAFIFEPVRMEEVLLDAKNEVSRSNEAFRVSFDFEQLPEQETSTLVNGNETLLKYAVVNLISNACKYSPDHRAEVLLGFDDTHCLVKVKDAGIGIAAEDIPHIFQPFYRAQNAMLHHRGFGVGLSVARRIVELHNGSLEVKSELHQGSEFAIRLPHC
ncbi:sensor histidine kinase [Larkinella sp. VNQ87]|uniref:sensor histidine kinase n=1 Tax=Larkinella sp. VNQ87 TaxID=3400921 RepID=UPI003BFE7B83